MDKENVNALVLLDLSAAIDTVNQKILLHCLWFGISCPAVSWFASYLHPHTQSIPLNQHTYAPTVLGVGVPQGSVLAPFLFTL